MESKRAGARVLPVGGRAYVRHSRSSGTTSSGSGYRPSIDFVNTSPPSRCTSKMPFAPGTTSTDTRSFSHSSRTRAARPAAFGRAPQGTQYSIRMRCLLTDAIQPRRAGSRPPSPPAGGELARGSFVAASGATLGR
jgi:hypothetical protein